MSEFKNVVIVGAGGLGKEIYGYIQNDIKLGHLEDVRIKGFIDDNFSLENNDLNLGTIKEYQFQEQDYFVIALGNIKIRTHIISKLESKKAKFLSYQHSTAYVASDVKLGKGNFLAPFTLINANSNIGDHNFLNSYSSIGHDCSLGDNNVMNPYSTILGECSVGNNNYFSTRSSIYPRLEIGNDCVISISTTVNSSLDDNITYFYRFKNKKLDNSVL